jgi:hypothetical protein
MSPLNISLADLIARLDRDLSDAPVLNKISEAQLRSHTLNALGDQLVGHYVAQAKQDGASWSEIGDAIGVSKQAAQQRWVPNTFDRFTKRARHAVVLSQEAARSHQHDHIGTEHVLLGLLGEPAGLAYRLLVTGDRTEEDVRAAAAEQLGEDGRKSPRGHIPFTAGSKQALAATLRECSALGHDFVGTEHMLLGLLAVRDGGAAKALLGLGIDLDDMRSMVAAETAKLRNDPRTTTD